MPNPVSIHPPRRLGAHAVAPAGVILVLTALAVAAFAGVARAESRFAFEPVVAHVQAAERVAFRSIAGGADLNGLTAVGTVESGALSIAEYAVVDGVLEVVFRLAGNEPVDIRQLVVVDATGRSHEVAIGQVVVRSAAETGASPLRGRGAIAYGDGVVLGAWLFENEREAPVVVTRLDLAPRDVARPFVLARTSERVPSFAEFERWVDAGRDAILASYRGAGSVPAARVEAGLRTAFPAGEVRRPSAPQLTVPAGGAVALMLTPASLDVDLATNALLLDARISMRTADGSDHVRFLPHLVRYAPRR
jgi:hypothetical protein